MTARRRSIAILREPARAEPLRAALADAGFEVVVQPVTRVEYLQPVRGEDWSALVGTADWVVFTSLNAVDALGAGSGGEAALSKALGGRRVAVLGGAAAERLGALGVSIDLLETRGTSGDLASALLGAAESGCSIVYPCAEAAMPALPRMLREAGHRVTEVVCYRTRTLSSDEWTEPDWSMLDGALVAAPSAVRALCELANPPADFGFFAIGPTTAAALRDAGLRVRGVADSPRVENVVRMVAEEVLSS